MNSRSSLVSFPHFCLAVPIICFHLPAIWSVFMIWILLTVVVQLNCQTCGPSGCSELANGRMREVVRQALNLADCANITVRSLFLLTFAMKGVPLVTHLLLSGC